MNRLTTEAAAPVALLPRAFLYMPDAEEEEPDEDKALAAALKKATLDGKYQMLLRQIKVPDDKDNYTDPHDYGLYEGTNYAGHDDLPKGYWTYVPPYWYIWREKKEDVGAKRAW